MSDVSNEALASPWNTTTPGDKHIPRFVTYVSPVSSTPASQSASKATALPLNLIALIISYLDDIGDVARITRTSKLLYYMTAPSLYAKVDLHAYPNIRYVNGRPEGYGSGSPFIMALNGLVTNTNGTMVKAFRLWGEWNEPAVDDFSKGRVPDNSMMLNVLVRAAVDRMDKLKSFSWELDCKPLKTLYQGLGAHNTLTTLTIKFPTSRAPRPCVMIPPMANLRAFKALGLDPLCYPDDISLLLLGSKKLEDLRLHFSPRMRREAESSLNFQTYFGRCMAANYKLPLKHFALHGFYGAFSVNLSLMVDHGTLRSVCMLDTFGGIAGSAATKFVDDTWRSLPPDMQTNFRATRCNEPAEQHVGLLSRSTGHERFYIVSTPRIDDTASPWAATPDSSTPSEEAVMILGRQYLHALTRRHGSTLKHLLLYDQWPLTEDDVSDLALHCPALEQLGLAIEGGSVCMLRLFLPFLKNLYALRLLGGDAAREKGLNEGLKAMEYRLEKINITKLRYVGMGDRVFRVEGRSQDENGTWKRDCVEVTRDDVRHIQIFGLDEMDISLEPLSFTP